MQIPSQANAVQPVVELSANLSLSLHFIARSPTCCGPAARLYGQLNHMPRTIQQRSHLRLDISKSVKDLPLAPADRNAYRMNIHPAHNLNVPALLGRRSNRNKTVRTLGPMDYV
jgi:hypothetical protein